MSENGNAGQKDDFIPTAPKMIIGFPREVSSKYDKEKGENTFFITAYAKSIRKGTSWEEAPSAWYKVVLTGPGSGVKIDFSKMMKVTGYEKTREKNEAGFSFTWFGAKSATQPLFGKKDISGPVPEGDDRIWITGRVIEGKCRFVDGARENMLMTMTLLLEGPDGERVPVRCESPVVGRVSFGVGDELVVSGFLRDGIIVPLSMDSVVVLDDFTRKRNMDSNGETIRLVSSQSPSAVEDPESLVGHMPPADPEDPFAGIDTNAMPDEGQEMSEASEGVPETEDIPF